MLTTDDIDKITADERKSLRGYCEHHDSWVNFEKGVDEEKCPRCGHKFSQLTGFQIATRRTPLPASKKKPKKH